MTLEKFVTSFKKKKRGKKKHKKKIQNLGNKKDTTNRASQEI